MSTSVDVSDSPFSAPTLTEIGELVVRNVRELVVLKLPLIAPSVEEILRDFATTPYWGSATTRSQTVENQYLSFDGTI